MLLPLLLTAAALAQSPTVVERGAHHNILERVTVVEVPDSDPLMVTNRYTELGDGINYQDQGEWKASVPEFQLIDGFAVAAQGQSKLTLPGNLRQRGAVMFTSPTGRQFRSTPLLLALRDPDSGESVLLGELRDTQGEQIANDTLIYRDAFDGSASASVRYTIRRSGFEQDIVLHLAIDPADWGLGPRSVIESWTETFDWHPPEQMELTQAGALEDVRLKWTDYQIGSGKAFALSGKGEEVAIAKRYGPVGERHFLVELVEARALKALFDELPAP